MGSWRLVQDCNKAKQLADESWSLRNSACLLTTLLLMPCLLSTHCITPYRQGASVRNGWLAMKASKKEAILHYNHIPSEKVDAIQTESLLG
jgi:hypothetical protein